MTRKACERCGVLLGRFPRVRLCRPCRRSRRDRLELRGYRSQTTGYAPPAAVDPTREARIGCYSARAAAGLSLFSGGGAPAVDWRA